MAKNGSKQKEKKKIATLTHDKAKRRNIPTAEFQSVMRVEEQSPVRVAYDRRNRDLDPQLVWRGRLYHVVSQGRIPVVRLSKRCIRFRYSDLLEWIETHTEKARGPQF